MGYTVTELVSGVRAVAVNPSVPGGVRIAMAGIPERMPAIGVLLGGVLSGQVAELERFSEVEVRVNELDDLPPNKVLEVGQSGQLVHVSEGIASGGLFSGSIRQRVAVSVGNSINSGFRWAQVHVDQALSYSGGPLVA